MRRWLFFFFALITACGARSTLHAPERRDATVPDGGMDGGMEMPDGGTLRVQCPRSPAFTAPRRLITLDALAESADPIVSQRWTLLSTPPTSMPLFSDRAPAFELTPDMVGSYFLRFDASDAMGRAASCEIEVQAIVGPPVAICPEEDVFTRVDAAVMIEGDGFDDEAIVRWQWDVVEAPAGAVPGLVGVDQPTLTFVSSTLGRYVLRLTVFDADMASGSCEVVVTVTGPPTVRCPSSPVNAPTRRPVTLTAFAEDDVGIASHAWEMLMRPSGSTAQPSPANAASTMLTPDRRGDYVLRYTATDVEGLSTSCEVTVIGTPTPPDLTCPGEVDTRPLTDTAITVSAIDDGTITRWQWMLVDRPEGSSANPPTPIDRPMTRFRPDIAGVYELMVTATDDDGLTASCRVRVNAGNVDGLRVEMFWDTNGTDMDTHLMRPEGMRWGTDDACYYANCNGGGLSWGAGGVADDPRLDIDDTDGFGPENINITTPYAGTYRVGVHAYRGSGRVTVRIYCGGSTTSPRMTFGPVQLRDGGGGNDFWRVADVVLTGASCTITDLSRGGRPWIDPWTGSLPR
jgi:hypothetical protein